MEVKRLLISRFSAMGDVAMCLPVVWSLAQKYKDLEIIFLSRKNFAPMFATCPGNVRFVGIDLKKDYKGIAGLNRLYKEIRNMRVDAYADFHDVLRTKYLRFRSFFSSIKTIKIDKGRSDKKRLVKKGADQCAPLSTTIERYADVLRKLGFDFTIDFQSIFTDNTMPEAVVSVAGQKDCKWIGIAPFAAHKGKILPLDKTELLVKSLSEQGAKVFLFGAGDKEKAILENWQQQYPNVISTAGKLGGLTNELRLISNLDCMVSMDSANMHLASLVGTRVVSVWGATHPAAGFLGYGQQASDIVQTPLPCRPCSIYGNKECRLSEKYKCLNDIDIRTIVDKVCR